MTNMICFRKTWPTKYFLSSFDDSLSSGVNKRFSNAESQSNCNFNINPEKRNRLSISRQREIAWNAISSRELLSTPLVHIYVSTVKGTFSVLLYFMVIYLISISADEHPTQNVLIDHHQLEHIFTTLTSQRRHFNVARHLSICGTLMLASLKNRRSLRYGSIRATKVQNRENKISQAFAWIFKPAGFIERWQQTENGSCGCWSQERQ